MAKIIDFSQYKQARQNKFDKSAGLTDVLKQAMELTAGLRIYPEEIFGVTPKEFKRILEVNLTWGVLRQKEIDFAAFRCSLYAADALANFLDKVPSWCGHDYLKKFNEKRDPAIFKEGGDAFLLMCSFFPERGDWVEMKLADYLTIGSRFYGFFYQLTGKDIGYYMKRYFAPTVNLVRKYALHFESLPPGLIKEDA